MALILRDLETVQNTKRNLKYRKLEHRRKFPSQRPNGNINSEYSYFSRSFAAVTAIPIVKVDMSTQTCDMSTQTVEISPIKSLKVVDNKVKDKKTKKSPSTRSRSPVKKTKSPVKKSKIILNRDSTKSMIITPIDRSSSADSAMDEDLTRPPHHRSDVARKKTK